MATVIGKGFVDTTGFSKYLDKKVKQIARDYSQIIKKQAATAAREEISEAISAELNRDPYMTELNYGKIGYSGSLATEFGLMPGWMTEAARLIKTILMKTIKINLKKIGADSLGFSYNVNYLDVSPNTPAYNKLTTTFPLSYNNADYFGKKNQKVEISWMKWLLDNTISPIAGYSIMYISTERSRSGRAIMISMQRLRSFKQQGLEHNPKGRSSKFKYERWTLNNLNSKSSVHGTNFVNKIAAQKSLASKIEGYVRSAIIRIIKNVGRFKSSSIRLS